MTNEHLLYWRKEQNKHIRVAFDVDGTLISGKGDPKENIINLYRFLTDELGCTGIIWSTAGSDYAKKIATDLNLKAEVFADKWDPEINKCITIAFDDEPEFFHGYDKFIKNKVVITV